jgi:Adenylate and Guanylate cyclase catalytic domain
MEHLTQIMKKHNQVANLQVVFADVEKYSKRRTQAQISVIDSLTNCLKNAIASISKEYLDYAQKNGLNFQTDIINLSTGDGTATIFSFDGLHNIHLNFALKLLEQVKHLRDGEPCAKFEEDGWCNCHSYFNLRIGISEGRGIIFKDLRDQFNAAGDVVNLSSRVMQLADRNQIIFSQQAYNQLIDLADDAQLAKHFVEFSDISLKHDVKIKAYQYINEDYSFLNNEPPRNLVLNKRMKIASEKMKAAGLPLPVVEDIPEATKIAMFEQFEHLASSLSNIAKGVMPPLTIEAKALPIPTKKLLVPAKKEARVKKIKK